MFMDPNDLSNLWPESPTTWSILKENSIDTLWPLQGPKQQLQVGSEVAQPVAAVESTQPGDNGNEEVDSEVAPTVAPVEFTQTDGNGNGNENVDSEVAPPIHAAAIQTDDKGKKVVDSEVTPSPLNHRKRPGASQAWDHFDLVWENKTRWAKCKYCPKKYKGYSSKKGTSNLLNHARKCTQSGSGDKPARETGKTKAKATVDLNREESNMSELERSNMKIARMIINRGYPLSMLANDLQPLQNLPVPERLKLDILFIFKEEKEKLRKSFTKFSSGHSNITVNLWKMTDTRIFCCLTSHLIDDGWKLKKMVLDFRTVTRQSISFWEVVDTLKRMLLEWNIGKKVCCITAVSSDEEVVEIVNHVKHWLCYDRGRKVFQINCFVHILDLLIQQGLHGVRDTFLKMINHLSSARDQTLKNKQLFGKAVEKARSKGVQVIYEDMPTNSSLNFEMLGSILGLRQVFLELLAIDSEYRNHPITEEDWDGATAIYNCLDVLYKAVGRFSESKCLTTNEYFPQVCNIYSKLQDIWEDNANPEILKPVADRMKVTINKFWEESVESLVIAVVLDPRFKFDIVKGWCEKIMGQHAEEECIKI
ncbi:zinc finger BED domain-containing protein RICESLEEPER 1-like [Mangifera indica]|uniref:zinc finger BED domain-containing protein RICESLEEPER 1-like n=1 Tax=Mangifera indica TaxID=29780 RepID=UPI001CFAC53A|nr:zinc finger BED domain-containing protein RICESLEEPER 1-like [Mangifera indica]